MKFNPNPFKFLEKRAEQSALRTVIETKLKSFEDNLAYAKIDWKRGPHEMEGIKEDALISLGQAVNCLNGYAGDIKTNFKLSEDVRKILDEIEKLSQDVMEIAHVENMKKVFKERGMERWDTEKKGPYVIEPMASQLHGSMNTLWSKIHTLKTADFDHIFSSNLEIDQRYK
jgi:hypothetical protein